MKCAQAIEYKRVGYGWTGVVLNLGRSQRRSRSTRWLIVSYFRDRRFTGGIRVGHQMERFLGSIIAGVFRPERRIWRRNHFSS
ncbi:hypothetical protein SBA3_240010 [Candidatus Sulfopaludibacter sp. SbA3]|nr:hypothetical protein SBA3_240010 [Candidatus Sulfopaludibacter sp. SbA3]